ncbi:glycosyltransferase family 2 protein [Ruegeria arenilitoris]|uniref:glycosyltransferase family 2 protein n=1 Tax=Ruegeria arenilitoris TaxID=1173585 RepID=UPI00147C1C3B|nr:glycosyltransferase family 2 protein [Ruegeria arenilitoris]
MSHAAEQMHDTIGWLQMYRLRMKRRRLLWRSFRSRHQLNSLSDRTRLIAKGDILSFTTLRNELERLPWFFRHYRSLGVDHFLMVDNGSDDGTVAYLQEQPDVSLWQTDASYRGSRFGLDWLTWLQMRYGHDHWTLMVDADELLIYAHHDTRSLKDLTAWLQNRGHSAFGALMLDMYPKGHLDQHKYDPQSNPLDLLNWFDSGPYRAQRQNPLGNLWVQGGVRERVFFADHPDRSPTLNKIPLVHWSRRYAYVNSCHSALPRYLNFAYDGPGGDTPAGVLLHTKFLPQVIKSAETEKERRQHFHDPDLFGPYYDAIVAAPNLWNAHSVRYTGWAQLEGLGLMNSKGWN